MGERARLVRDLQTCFMVVCPSEKSRSWACLASGTAKDEWGVLFHWAANNIRTALAKLATAGAIMACEADTRPLTQRRISTGSSVVN